MAASRADILAIEANLRELERRRTYNKLGEYKPFTKQLAFHALSKIHTQSCFGAANQIGKTYSGAAQAAVFLTGRYPEWWPGRRFSGPTIGTVLGTSAEATRDSAQRLLLGTEAEGHGTGLIPADCLDRTDMKTARGVSGVFDTVFVKHEGGKMSTLKFKSYEKGREKLQGDTIDWFWEDEEPPADIHGELLARITVRRGIGWLTFTPLKGITKLAAEFYDEPGRPRLVRMGIEESPLFTPEMIAEQKKKYPKHEWAARLSGEPQQGEGAVFTFTMDSISCDAFDIPDHWSWAWGLDFGTGHPFAAVLLAWDRENDAIYVVHCIKMADSLPLQQAEAMKRARHGFGARIPAMWPQDGTQRKEYDGKLEPLAAIFKKHGIAMHHEHVKWLDGSNSTEAGIMDMQERMASGRLKVFRHLSDWFKEYGRYHRKDGLLVKTNDDLMSATRVGVMGIRFAKPVFFSARAGSAPTVQMAEGWDASPFDN